MKAIIFENLNELNKYLAVGGFNPKDVTIDFRSFVVGELKDKNGEKKYEIVDRILVIENF